MLGKAPLDELPPDDLGPDMPVIIDWIEVHNAEPCPTMEGLQKNQQAAICCGKNCITEVMNGEQSEGITAMIEKFKKMSFQDQQIYMTHLIKKSHAGRKWYLCGMQVCRKAFVALFGICEKRLAKLIETGSEPGEEPLVPFDARMSSTASGRPCTATLSADVFFKWLYEEVATDIPKNVLVEELPADLPPIVVNDTDDPVAANIEIPKDKKWLSPMTILDLHAMYVAKSHLPDGNPASLCVFRRRWRMKWNKVLGMCCPADARDHWHKCKVCANLDKELRGCQDTTKKDMLQEERQKHLKSMLLDQELEHRLNTMSENSCSDQCKLEEGRLLKIDIISIPSMDQATWKCPFPLEKLWRPNLHLLGVIAWGVLEKYVIFPPNVPKDASGMLTVFAQALDDVEQILTKRGLEMPSHISVQLDNTTSENEVSPNLLFSAYLASTNCFETYQTNFTHVGHTKRPCDKHSRGIRDILCQAERILEVPRDFADCILEKMQPNHNREILAEVAGKTYQMSPWVDQLGIHISSLIPNPGQNLKTIHMWRVVQRRALDAYVMKNTDSWQV